MLAADNSHSNFYLSQTTEFSNIPPSITTHLLTSHNLKVLQFTNYLNSKNRNSI